MAKETETQAGQCPSHGNVQGTREIPEMGFPFVYFAIARSLAKRRPFKCPECGAALQSS